MSARRDSWGLERGRVAGLASNLGWLSGLRRRSHPRERLFFSMAGGDVVGYVGGVASHSVNLFRGLGVEELEADEVEARFVLDDASTVLRLLRTKHGKVDPRETWVETSAPHHVFDIEAAPVLQLWLAFDYPDGPWHSLYSCFCQILGLDADQWITRQHLGASSPPDGGTGGKNPMEDDPAEERHQHAR